MTPDGLLARGLLAKLVGHGLEEGVGFVVALSKGEKEWLENTVAKVLGDDVLNICHADQTGGIAVSEH